MSCKARSGTYGPIDQQDFGTFERVPQPASPSATAMRTIRCPPWLGPRTRTCLQQQLQDLVVSRLGRAIFVKRRGENFISGFGSGPTPPPGLYIYVLIDSV